MIISLPFHESAAHAKSNRTNIKRMTWRLSGLIISNAKQDVDDHHLQYNSKLSNMYGVSNAISRPNSGKILVCITATSMNTKLQQSSK
jgi:nitrate reductase NapAB chaperone NapD